MERPTEIHVAAVKRILRYLKSTISYGLWYEKGKNDELTGWSDSDYAGDLDDRKSTSGYVFMIGSKVVSWSSKKQSIVTLSTTEAEFIAAANCACQAIWLGRVLDHISSRKKECITLYCDNSSTIKLSKNPMMHGRSKHIDVRFHFLRDLTKDGKIQLLHCSSFEQITDIMTKALTLVSFCKFRDLLGLSPKCVIKNLVRIQRNFLWGGGIEDKKLCWVKWEHVCLPKEQGDLGVKNLELFNVALLSKWKWRGIVEKDAIWYDLLHYRYGFLPTVLLCKDIKSVGSKDSLWWRDVISAGESLKPGWFRSNISCVVGNGTDVSFWNTKWCGNSSFAELFPNLFKKELWQNSVIANKVITSNEGLVWQWEWRDVLSQLEEQNLNELKDMLIGIHLNPNNKDRSLQHFRPTATPEFWDVKKPFS
ncbi:unnamed protein product [Trifolium pratense]|uniref:Uncharacterized protein n=1 Tax=Trifolium pratense TaxID=57577 RepID=A0ACB0KL85_TRIPR|nr:unnamed protein product [Trifolium pratense]